MAHKQALSLSPQTLRSVPFIELRQSPASDRVAYFIAHDLRHHLSAVYANAELMCNKHYVQSEREEMLEDIKGAVACMTEAMESLLVHSRTGCLLQLRLEPLKLIIEKATQMVRSHPDADRVEFIHENMPLIEVSADSTWLCSAIFNLLLNACQAVQLSSDVKKVSVTCHEGPNDVYIRIIDSGPGVPVTIQKSLFQPFVNVRLRKGTGLGLAIVHSIVREHGGDVSLEESRPGNTSFVVRLPRPDRFKTNAHIPEATVYGVAETKWQRSLKHKGSSSLRAVLLRIVLSDALWNG